MPGLAKALWKSVKPILILYENKASLRTLPIEVFYLVTHRPTVYIASFLALVGLIDSQGRAVHCRYATPLHYTTLHYTTLHYATLHYTTIHYNTLHYTTLNYSRVSHDVMTTDQTAIQL